jgi:5-methyltetrahydrofolate--homocysteine methyltransferase
MADRFMRTLGRRVLLFDGGMGSMMISEGLESGEIPESWVERAPEKLEKIHLDYIEAGAGVIQTATFGASGIKLSCSAAGAGLEPAVINRRAAEIARQAAESSGRDPFVAGDIGPTGKFFPPVGELDEKKALESFREQAAALAEGGVDLFLIETMSDLREALTALRAAREAADLPVVVELTFQEKPGGFFTIMGNTPEKALETLRSEGADMAGANCTLDSTGMIALAARMTPGAGIPLLFQPNAGQPVMRNGRPEYLQDPEDFASDIEEIVKLGADAVGGCCGTDPEFIQAARKRLG